jgi:hypothetical protein
MSVTSANGTIQRGTTASLGYQSSGSTLTAASVTAVVSNELVLGLYADGSASNSTWTGKNGFSFGSGSGTSSNSKGICSAAKSSAGAISPTATYGASATIFAGSVAIEP